MVMLNRKDWMVIANVATPIPPNTKAVGYPWRDFMKSFIKKWWKNNNILIGAICYMFFLIWIRHLR